MRIKNPQYKPYLNGALRVWFNNKKNKTYAHLKFHCRLHRSSSFCDRYQNVHPRKLRGHWKISECPCSNNCHPSCLWHLSEALWLFPELCHSWRSLRGWLWSASLQGRSRHRILVHRQTLHELCSNWRWARDPHLQVRPGPAQVSCRRFLHLVQCNHYNKIQWQEILARLRLPLLGRHGWKHNWMDQQTVPN